MSGPRLRWGMLGLCFSATAINYIDRANLSIAAPQIQHRFGFSPSEMGLIFSAFFWSYAVMQLPMGWLIDRFGPKRIYTLAVGWWSVFTAGTAFGQGMASLLGCRILLGVGESGAYPCDAKVTALWFSLRQRGWASAVFDSGSRVGSALSFPIVGSLIALLGWRRSFVATGGLGFLWLVAWLLVYRDPTPAEAREIGSIAAAPPAAAGAAPRLRWRDLFRYRTVWGMMVGFSCLNFVSYFFITWFPTYLFNARGFSLSRVSTLGMMPAICAIVGGWIGGTASDALYRRGWSLTAARKTCLAGGMLLSSSIGLAAVVPSVGAALACFCLANAGVAFAGASVWCLPADVAPSAGYVASLGGIQNFASNVAGAVTSSFTGILLTLTKGSFVLPLAIGGGVSIAGAAAFVFLIGKIEPLGASARG